jgi:protein ImuA
MADTAVPSLEFAMAQNRAQGPSAARATLEELRRLLPGTGDIHSTLPFGLPAIDSHLPQSGLTCGALHEIVPETAGTLSAAFGFVVAVLSRLPPGRPLFLVMPAYGQRDHGRLCGHGLNGLGLDPVRVTLVETAHRKETLWAVAEALHSGVPQAVVGMIDRLAASDTGLPLFLIRPTQTLEASAASTRWRVGVAEAVRDRFGFIARPRWHLQLERCRNGRPGEWKVEYDHVTHRFSLAAALADHAFSGGAGARSYKQAGRS